MESSAKTLELCKPCVMQIGESMLAIFIIAISVIAVGALICFAGTRKTKPSLSGNAPAEDLPDLDAEIVSETVAAEEAGDEIAECFEEANEASHCGISDGDFRDMEMVDFAVESLFSSKSFLEQDDAGREEAVMSLLREFAGDGEGAKRLLLAESISHVPGTKLFSFCYACGIIGGVMCP